jgi:hypothetical protein
MTNTDELIIEWLKLTNQINKLKSRLEPIEQELLGRLKVGDPVPIPKKAEKIVKRDRAQLDPEKLHEEVSDDVWETITELKPVADRIKVAIRDGLLTQDTVTVCSTRTKPWLAITKK